MLTNKFLYFLKLYFIYGVITVRILMTENRSFKRGFYSYLPLFLSTTQRDYRSILLHKE